MRAKLPKGTLEKLWHDPDNWRAIYFYYCPGDPRIVVPKKNKWSGWTMNFARPSAWIALVLAILIPLGVIFYLRHAGSGFWVIPGLALFAVVSVLASFFLSSTARFEEDH